MIIKELSPPPQIDLFLTCENKSSIFHLALPSSFRFGDGRDESGLESMGDDLPFPPMSLILMLINLRLFGGMAYVVAPQRPGRLWFNELQACSRSHRRLPPDLYQIVNNQKIFSPSLLNDNFYVWTLSNNL